ncbi:MAG TPA: integrating conjugative element protein, partial [Burkholderiaceae bacterium]|nr:integrating conjugative element protein [Burkholderiaceae bacterium]
MQRIPMITTAAMMGLMCSAAVAQLQGPLQSPLERPTSQQSLYYRMGGGDPAGRANKRNPIALQLGLGGTLRLNYSCGRFDIGLSWANLMNGFSQVGTQVQGAVRSGIAALPMYIFQRVQPGLYELFQTYSQKAEAQVGAALKTCEEMEAQIKAGGDPYEEWARLAKGDAWKVQASATGDVLTAKTNVEQRAGRDGMVWIGGNRRGGAGQQPVRLVRDLVTAGYNATLINHPVGGDTTDYSTDPALGQTKLARTFARPVDAAQFAVDVLGDQIVATCGEAECPAKGSSIGIGLAPKFEAEIPPVQAALQGLVTAAQPNYARLGELDAPGVVVTPEVIEALREMPAGIRSITADRLSKEIALARTIDK